MGSQRFTRSARRKPPEPSPARTVSKPVHRGGDSTHIQRVKEMQSLLGNQKTNSLLEKEPEKVTDPAERDALQQVAHSMFQQVITTIPSLLGLSGQLLTSSPQPLMPGPQSAMVLISQLQVQIGMLDGAIAMYEKSGGRLAEIYPIIAIRAQLSTALFHAKLGLGGAPNGNEIHAAILDAVRRGAEYHAEQAQKKSGQEQLHGPKSHGDVEREKVEDLQMRLVFLGPPGQFPSAGALKK